MNHPTFSHAVQCVKKLGFNNQCPVNSDRDFMNVMFYWLVSIFLGLMMSGCVRDDQRPSGADRASLAEFTENWFEAFNRRDTVFLLTTYAPDAILEDPDHPDKPVKGNVAILESLNQLFHSIPDVQDSVRSLTVEGNRVAVEFISTGSTMGQPFRMRIMSLLEFDSSGKIIRDATYFDRQIN